MVSQNSAKATALTKNTDKSTAFTGARALANRIKAHPADTVAFGQQLEIIGAEDTTDLTQQQPTLKAQAVTPGSANVDFAAYQAAASRPDGERAALESP